jgi:hypothetical protein
VVAVEPVDAGNVTIDAGEDPEVPVVGLQAAGPLR